MKKHRTGFLVLMLCLASALFTFNSCSKDDKVEPGGDATIRFPGHVTLSNDGASAEIALELGDNTAWTAQPKEGADWCRVVPASGNGSGTFVVTVEPNAKRLERSVEVIVTAATTTRTLTVCQKDTLGVSARDILNIPNAGDSVTIEVAANTAWEVIKPDFRAGWVSFTPDHGQGKGEVVFVVQPNKLTGVRETEVIFSAGNATRVITILQQDVTPTSESDSLALIALYRATDGAYWSSPWDLKKSIATWRGVTTALVDGQYRVTALNLPGMGLEGKIPSEIGNLTAIESLDLSYNNLRGEIPSEIGKLTLLRELKVDDNKFEGEIPLSIKQLVNLEELGGKNNRFRTFPVEICQLSKLKIIHLERNEISELPGEIVGLSNLEYLYLNDNKLTALPDGLDNLPKLFYLHADNNEITEFPAEIGNLVNLVSLRLNDNKITGQIPAGLSNLVWLKYLYLDGNRFDGGFPSDMWRMTALEVLSASGCSITGAVPEFGKNGTFANVSEIFLDGNHLTGQITEDLSNLTNLKWFYVDDNELDGTLPADALGNMNNLPQLISFSVSNNYITGSIPAGFAERLSRWTPAFNKLGFRLNGNSLTGPVPKEFGNPMWNITQYNYAENLYPQRNGVVLELEQ